MATSMVIDREVLLRATRGVVYGYLSDPARFAAWWGAGSTIEPRVGGGVLIRFVNGVEVGGELLELVPGERVVFTYGFRDPGKKPAWGGSRVLFRLADRPDGTALALRHEFPDSASRDGHVAGWGYQLAVLAGLVAREQHAALGDRVDAWFAAWSSDDPAERSRLLTPATADGVKFRDAWAVVSTRDELLAHITAAKRHMPGVRIERSGEPRHVQGCVLVDWQAKGPDGKAAMRGTNVFELAPDGRIAGGVGFPA
ncbi:MAG: SRPBCC domain-containing protein [Planctomycetota bacterium]|nr:SRPBCC domain-containing protein [Planctomycetota bacterium]